VKIPVLSVNLLQDLIQEMRKDLVANCYDESALVTDEAAHFAYYNVLHRLIHTCARRVLKATNFDCPVQYRLGLSALEAKISAGGDLSPHLSSRIRKHDFNDAMLNDWGIHHLHLGIEIGENGFVERTGLVLFVKFEASKAYFIGVKTHKSWSDQDCLRILHANWPESIATYRLPEGVSLRHLVSDKEVQDLRKAKINTPIEVEPGVIYQTIGGGYASSGASKNASSGVSIKVTEAVMRDRRCCKKLEQMLFERFDTIRNEAMRGGVELPIQTEFKLVVEGDCYYAREASTGYRVKVK
jgi:hypothetical protein